jgi:hypothetical protein
MQSPPSETQWSCGEVSVSVSQVFRDLNETHQCITEILHSPVLESQSHGIASGERSLKIATEMSPGSQPRTVPSCASQVSSGYLDGPCYSSAPSEAGDLDDCSNGQAKNFAERYRHKGKQGDRSWRSFMKTSFARSPLGSNFHRALRPLA